MNENEKFQGDELVRKPTKKSRSFLFYSSLSLIVAGLGGAIYYFAFQPDLSFLGFEKSAQETTFQNNQIQTTPNAQNLNKESQNSVGAVNFSGIQAKNTSKHNNSSETRNLVNLPKNLANDSGQNFDQNNLPVSDMQNMANSTENNQENSSTEDGEFIINPPEKRADNLPSEQEFQFIGLRNQNNFLQQLQQAKNDTAKNNTESLPDNKFALSSESAKDSQDLHITNIFVSELAKLAVEKYFTQVNEQKSPLTATEAARYFGTTMKGLTHPNGRLGIFSYAYNPQLITIMTKTLAPELIKEMEKIALENVMSPEQTNTMFEHYAQQANITARQLEAIISSSDLDSELEQYLQAEESLVQYRKDFANAQLEFSELARKKDDTKALEDEMKNMAINANDAELKLKTIRNTIIENIAKKASTTPNNSLLDLALWIKRRNNEDATKSAIEALYYVSELLAKKQ